MKVHHLNCGSLLPPATPRLVCHVLLVESPTGLVLVDTGFGLADIADPARRLGSSRRLMRPVLDAEETAVRQVERLGFTREDVRHIVLTHFDLDHIGGLADFPHATVHATAAEVRGAMVSPSRRERNRFRPAQWAHGPKIVEHGVDGEPWRGFAAAEELTDVAPGIVLISMPGHTRGHAAVAVDAGERWVLHAGDAFYVRPTLDGEGRVPATLRALESAMAFDGKQLRENQARLADLYRQGDPGLLIVSAHDPELLEKARASA